MIPEEDMASLREVLDNEDAVPRLLKSYTDDANGVPSEPSGLK